ncbi:coiled-coil domain-containing protein 186-like isoform X1 [Nerophis lumbriciformis]|uniref:coiled-coil domain-containing protein 186-like isoform X1 n=1 Tax=Nerophis lumbriciformis TaxID=546530 RepID=UPI003BAA92F1
MEESPPDMLPNGHRDERSPQSHNGLIQFKYDQQENSILRLLEENKRHQDLILGIFSEKDNMKDLLRELKETRDKLLQQDQAAKAGLMQMQKEITHCLEQELSVLTVQGAAYPAEKISSALFA